MTSCSNFIISFCLLLLLQCSLAAELGAAPQARIQLETLSAGNSSLQVEVVETTYMGQKFHAIRLLQTTHQGKSISLQKSPIWRADFRSLDDLHDPSQPSPNHAPWALVPSLKPNQNSQAGSDSTIVWLPESSTGQRQVMLTNANNELTLCWYGIDLADWPLYNLQGSFDVSV